MADSMTRQQRETAARTAADAVLTQWPEIERDRALGQALRSNADAIHRQSREALWQPGGHPLLFRAGNSLGNSGLVTSAVDYWQKMADTAATCLGPDHPDTLTTRNNLAFWQAAAGNPAPERANTDGATNG